jgi:hypothetical protein
MSRRFCETWEGRHETWGGIETWATRLYRSNRGLVRPVFDDVSVVWDTTRAAADFDFRSNKHDVSDCTRTHLRNPAACLRRSTHVAPFWVVGYFEINAKLSPSRRTLDMLRRVYRANLSQNDGIRFRYINCILPIS